MNKFSAGERVAAYGYANTGYASLAVLGALGKPSLRSKGVVVKYSTGAMGLVCIRLDHNEIVWVHENQCRRLKPKLPKSGAV